MYEIHTYEAILQRMLDKVPNNIDKREGSIIYNALAPAAAELAQMYIELDAIFTLTFADTASGEYLARRTAELGVNRKPATKAIRLGLFTGAGDVPFNPPIGSRFSGNNLTYTVLEKITDGVFRMECETAGTSGNQYFGNLLPIDYIAGLSTATLADVLVPGENEESDESLRQRYFNSLTSQAFGGNIADYKQKVNELSGVGGVKVYPGWNGGGTVKLTIIDSNYKSPSSTLINDIQTAVDPEGNQGEGFGIAPIGHIVTIVGVDETEVNVKSEITLQNGYSWEDVQPGVEAVISDYFTELCSQWADSAALVVRISQIETRVLGVTGILDIQNTKLNDIQQNLVLGADEIPVLGEVSAI